MTTYPFVKARWFTSANRGKGDILFLVVHDMEMAEKPTTAESCANYFATTTTQASSHYTIDNDSIVQCVLDKDVAWCAPGANSNGLHMEHAGFASQTRVDWLDPFGVAMLARSAALFAEKCHAYGIPPRKGDYNDIRAGRPCIVGHWDITKAYPDKGSHTDPGANFPWDYFIGLVQAAYNGTTNTAPQGDDMPTMDELAPMVRLQTLGALADTAVAATPAARQARDAIRAIVRGELGAVVAAADVDETKLAQALAPIVVGLLPATSGVTVDTLAAALRDVLRTGTGTTP